ncbi:hypothetical protein N4G62_16290, partial [Sphingomonas sanguinis]
MLIKRLNGGKARGGARLGTGWRTSHWRAFTGLSSIRHVFWVRRRFSVAFDFAQAERRLGNWAGYQNPFSLSEVE